VLKTSQWILFASLAVHCSFFWGYSQYGGKSISCQSAIMSHQQIIFPLICKWGLASGIAGLPSAVMSCVAFCM